MKAIRQHAYGGPESLSYNGAPEPALKAGEVLVEVRAAGVTPTELFWQTSRTTQSGTPRRLPFIPGHEFSGELAARGEGVAGFSVGEAIYGMNDWFSDGAQAEYCLARVDDIARKPTTVDHAHAAVTPISALTAWQGLFGRAGIEAGQHVLIHGAAGGVGSFAVQFAHWRGARITATVSATNIDFVRELGADNVIDYRAERFEERVRGVDAVFDTVGGDTLRRSWSVLKARGRLVTIAASEEGSQDERTREAFFIVEPRRTELEEIARLIDAGHIRPVVGAEFPLADAIKAYQTKPIRGKVVLLIDGAGQ
jgi:NADPH:quinone reductase-like Zn-dependent oxidoreductase